MNLHALTLRYLGWCPGVDSVARWIPDKEYSNRRVLAPSMTVFIILLGFSLYYHFSMGEPSYSWDVEFTEAVYDDITDMYMVEKTTDTNGVYNLTIWADSTAGGNILIRWIYRGPKWDVINQEWLITDGVIRCPPDEYGLHYSSYWSTRASAVWRIYSNSRDQKVHIRIQYLKEVPVWQPP